MHGFPLDISKNLLKDLIGNLRSEDRFNVVLFAGGSTVMSETSVAANFGNIARALNVINNQQGGGGTELLPALKRALALPKAEGFSRTIVIATDGYVSVEEEAFDLIRNNLDNANMFAFGIGSSVNRHLIEGMAHVGQGEPFVITKPEEATSKAEAFRKLIQSPVLTRVKVDFGRFDVYDVEPASIPDVLADRPVIVFGKWRGSAEGTILLSGLTGEKPYSDEIRVSSVKPERTNASLPYLWARQRIMLLSDYNLLRQNDERIKEVTNLGLTYNLLTAYTSFIAVDSEVRNKNGKTTTVNQPLPLPEGVSDYAVSGAAARSAAAPVMMKQKNAAAEAETLLPSKLEDKAALKFAAVQSLSIKISKIKVTGGLGRDAVRSTLEQELKTLQACFQNVSLRGVIEARLTLAANGMVKNVQFINSATKNETVKQCILQQIKSWQFPASADGKDTEVTVTFLLGS
jgi:Ca-activated chloride channel family protein